jgi:hypothetical protein
VASLGRQRQHVDLTRLLRDALPSLAQLTRNLQTICNLPVTSSLGSEWQGEWTCTRTGHCHYLWPCSMALQRREQAAQWEVVGLVLLGCAVLNQLD